MQVAWQRGVRKPRLRFYLQSSSRRLTQCSTLLLALEVLLLKRQSLDASHKFFAYIRLCHVSSTSAAHIWSHG